MNVDLDLDANVDADVVAVVHLDAAGGGSCRRRGMFGFQRLDVYRASTQFLGLTSKLVARIPRGTATSSTNCDVPPCPCP